MSVLLKILSPEGTAEPLAATSGGELPGRLVQAAPGLSRETNRHPLKVSHLCPKWYLGSLFVLGRIPRQNHQVSHSTNI